MTATPFPRRENLEGEYFEACKRCEEVLNLTPAARSNILEQGQPRYDKREHGNHGLCLTADVPDLGLATHDRLEPSAQLPDLGESGSVPIAGTLQVVFWATSRETMARHRCPLFSTALGTDPCRTVAFDTLHALYLGVMNTFCKQGYSGFSSWAVLGAAAARPMKSPRLACRCS